MSEADSTIIERFLKTDFDKKTEYDNLEALNLLPDRGVRRRSPATKNIAGTVIPPTTIAKHGAAPINKRAEKTMEKRLTCSIKESAELLGVHENTIRNHIRSGRLEASHLGRRHLVSMKSIRELAGLPQVAV